MVERGVAERVRLKQTYDKRTDDLQKQHESVKNALTEHRNKVQLVKYVYNFLNVQIILYAVLTYLPYVY